jgi:hypothetical protein
LAYLFGSRIKRLSVNVIYSMKKIIAALTFAMLSQTVMAAEWYLVETTKNVSFFVDKSSMVRSGSKVKFWQWTIRNSLTGNPAYDNSKVLNVANCRDRTIKLEQFLFFSGEDPVDGGVPSKEFVQQIIPDTAFETVYKTVCNGKFNGKPLSKLSVSEVQAAMTEFYAEQPKR